MQKQEKVNKNCYEILGVNPDISFKELKKVYYELALKWHPDKWSTKSEAERKTAEEKFKEISVAYKEILEERESKLAVADAESTEKNKAAADTDNKEEKKEVEEELRRVDEWVENHEFRSKISDEVICKMRELHAQGLNAEEAGLASLWVPYRNLFEKLWSDSLNKEEVINFKNQLFIAIEEAIKKVKHKKDQSKEVKDQQSKEAYESVHESFRKKAVEELDGMVKNFKKKFNLSTAKTSDLSEIRDAIEKLNDWKESSVNLGQNKEVFEQNSMAKDYLEELEKKEEELKKSSEVASHSPYSQKEEQSDSEQSNQLNKQETEIKDQLQSMQSQLNQLQIQIKSLLASQNQNSTDQSNQFHQIQEQLNTLQSQIQNWEKQDAPRILVSQPDRQKLVELKNQAQELQKNLQSRDQQKREEHRQTDIQPPKKEFNWLYVVIPMGAVIVGLLFLLLRKERKDD